MDTSEKRQAMYAPGTNHLEKRLNMLCRRNNVCIVGLVHVRYDDNRPSKLEEMIECVEEDSPGLVPPIYSMVLKVSNICRITLSYKRRG